MTDIKVSFILNEERKQVLLTALKEYRIRRESGFVWDSRESEIADDLCFIIDRQHAHISLELAIEQERLANDGKLQCRMCPSKEDGRIALIRHIRSAHGIIGLKEAKDLCYSWFQL
jgi:hypothetical protein